MDAPIDTSHIFVIFRSINTSAPAPLCFSRTEENAVKFMEEFATYYIFRNKDPPNGDLFNDNSLLPKGITTEWEIEEELAEENMEKAMIKEYDEGLGIEEFFSTKTIQRITVNDSKEKNCIIFEICKVFENVWDYVGRETKADIELESQIIEL